MKLTASIKMSKEDLDKLTDEDLRWLEQEFSRRFMERLADGLVDCSAAQSDTADLNRKRELCEHGHSLIGLVEGTVHCDQCSALQNAPNRKKS